MLSRLSFCPRELRLNPFSGLLICSKRFVCELCENLYYNIAFIIWTRRLPFKRVPYHQPFWTMHLNCCWLETACANFLRQNLTLAAALVINNIMNTKQLTINITSQKFSILLDDESHLHNVQIGQSHGFEVHLLELIFFLNFRTHVFILKYFLTD